MCVWGGGGGGEKEREGEGQLHLNARSTISVIAGGLHNS